ncbi:serine hydrolase [Micromonospora sp. LOL_023]|uniref:serine hydrolase n=1 Tax=Micromonospora sp. LOL_023 TaxID=3345418 RepID=UPI003A87B3F5
MGVANVLRLARSTLEVAGLRGSFLVRDLRTGDELGIDPDLEFPAASLVKVPLAVVTLERIRRGELDAAARILVHPDRVTAPGPTGLSKFRHPAEVAVEDLLYLSTAISDGAAADALFGLTPPAEVTTGLRRLGLSGIIVRHPISDLTDTPAERFAPQESHLAQSLAIGAATTGHGHPVAQLDVSRASTGSARAFVDLLHELWRPSTVDQQVAGRVRELMGDNVLRQRLAPDFSSDAARWSSKTGTLLNLRHEIGVVEHANGQVYAVAALTESRVPAVVQPAAEASMAHVARSLHDELRLVGG